MIQSETLEKTFTPLEPSNSAGMQPILAQGSHQRTQTQKPLNLLHHRILPVLQASETFNS